MTQHTTLAQEVPRSVAILGHSLGYAALALRAAPVAVLGYFLGPGVGLSRIAGAAVGAGIAYVTMRAVQQSKAASLGSEDDSREWYDYHPVVVAGKYWYKYGISGGVDRATTAVADIAVDTATDVADAATDLHAAVLKKREEELRKKRIKQATIGIGVALIGVGAMYALGRGQGAGQRKNPKGKSKGPSWVAVGVITALAAADTVTPGFPFPGSAVIMVPAAAATWLAKLNAMGVLTGK